MASKGKALVLSSCSTSGNSHELNNQEGPLWKHVKKLDLPTTGKRGGGNRPWVCNFCGTQYIGTYYRVKGHLLKTEGTGISACKKVDADMLKVLQKLQDDFESKKKNATLSTILSFSNDEPNKKRKGDSGTQGQSKTTSREDLDRKIGRLFFSASLPFNLARNPYWKDLVTSLANSNLQGYVPPSSEKLRTTILKEERNYVDKLLEYKKFSWEENGVSIVCDGWIDNQRHPLINFFAVSIKGPIFLKVVDASGEYKNPTYMKNLFAEIVKEVGPNKVVQLITDNDMVYRTAGLSLEDEFPHIYWTPCVAHTLKLVVKTICSPPSKEQNPKANELCAWIGDLEKDAQLIINFVLNHHDALSLYNRYSNVKMLKIGETRFTSMILMITHIKLVRDSLVQMVADADWSFYRSDDEEKSQTIKKCVLDDLWWDKVDYFLEFTGPIWEMLKLIDVDEPMLHRVYEMWDNMVEKIQGIIFRHEKKDHLVDSSNFFDYIQSILVDAWKKSNTPLHCAAHSLIPMYYGKKWLSSRAGRVPPHQDSEISKHRSAYLSRVYSDTEHFHQVQEEFARFVTGVGLVGGIEAIKARDEVEPITWWVLHGASVPLLQRLALRLLAQPVTLSSRERNWSKHSQIQTIRKNKLSTSRAEDLVYVRHNLRLITKGDEKCREGASKFWDMDVEEFDIEGEPELNALNMNVDESTLPSFTHMDYNGENGGKNEEIEEVAF
ncbi:uncharacterized protein LOC116257376 [Nymphaea colorata]|nr:uncharacterized protein LOC116257376 [Nymphaea colorata]XP_031489922.1 uncharacterized protein LOC116257376 [Nymphaea colorata]